MTLVEVIDTPVFAPSNVLALLPSGNAVERANRLLEHISELLAAAQTIQEVKRVHDLATAARDYVRRQRLSVHIVRQARAINVEAMRKLGGMLIDMAKAAGGRPYHAVTGTLKVPVQTLRDLGISKNQSSRWQQLYQLPEDTFRDIRDGRISFLGALAAQRRARELEALLDKINRERDAQLANMDLHLAGGIDLLTSGIRPDLVITEPPMDSLPMLASACVNVPFVALGVRQRDLPTVLSVVGRFLTYRGIGCNASGSIFVPDAKVSVLFCGDDAITRFKERRKSLPRLRSPQGTIEAWEAHVISQLSLEGDLVVDPFMTNSKTATAAFWQLRRFVGATLDAAVIKETRQKIAHQHHEGTTR